MRKIIAGFATSLDGYIEGPNGEYDWITYDKEIQNELAFYWKEIDTMFYGRKTYEMVLAMSRKTKTNNNPFAHMKHYVFSNSLGSVDDSFTLVEGKTESEVQKIKKQPGKNIAIFGGAELACSLFNLKLIDELVLTICPILLGNGKPFFRNIQNRIYFELINSKSFSSGVVSLTYKVKNI